MRTHWNLIFVRLFFCFFFAANAASFLRWEKESWDVGARWQDLMHKQNLPKSHHAEKPDEDERKAFKEQAKELKEDKESWRPTWQALGLDFSHKELAKPKETGPPTPRWWGRL